MATEQKENDEVKQGSEPSSVDPETSLEQRSEAADRVDVDVKIANESASSEVIELGSEVLEELGGDAGSGVAGPPGPLNTDMVQRFVGTVINGRYCIEEVIGRGGMGVVFKARHQTLDRPVVIKVLRPSKIDSDLARKRFEREAKRLCLLDHPNVVTIYDFGYHDGLGYLVMEYVDGITLTTFLKDNGPLTFGQFAPMVAGVLGGLSAAHKAGIVHRDIKASNAMLVVKNNMIERIKLLDFGLAKLVTGSEDLTKKSELIGSMSAMAPERILGSAGDERVDIYAVGIMAYYLLTGEKPFKGEDVQVLYAHVHDPPPPMQDKLPEDHDVPSTVIEFIELCLAKDPEDRPRDANEALEWLNSTVNNRAIFRLDEYPMEVPHGDQRPEDSRSSRKMVFEEGTPSWARERESSSIYSFSESETSTKTSGNGDSSKVKKVAIGMGALALILGIVGWFAFSGPTEQVEPPEPSAKQEEKEAEEKAASIAAQKTSNIDAVMAQIEKAVEEQRYGAAGEMLNSIRDRLNTRPELLSDAADLSAAIKKGQAFVDAQRYEEQQELAKAIAAYRKVINIDPRDETAQEKLSKLEASSLLSIESNVDAAVFMDGKEVGTTPFQQYLPAERVDIVLKAKGYEDWTKAVSLPKGKEHELTASLEKKYKPAPRRRIRKNTNNKKKKKSGSDDSLKNDSLMEMDNDSLMQME